MLVCGSPISHFPIDVTEGMSPEDSPDFSVELVPILPGTLRYPGTLDPSGEAVDLYKMQ